MESERFLQLVNDQNSPDNNVRTRAELDFKEAVTENPSQAAYTLIQLASDVANLPLDLRQSCLLHLRRLVPKYWSLGFASFVGPPISQDIKQLTRQGLVTLATSSAESKIRSGCAYVITQIAAADYPDEWPDLLSVIYRLTTNYDNEIAVIGGLTVLNELFDDLITEDQFWEGGIGNQLISHIMDILKQPQLNPSVKTTALKLYLSVANTLRSPEAFDTKERVESVNAHIVSSTTVYSELLNKSIDITTNSPGPLSLTEISFRSSIYNIISNSIADFYKKVPTDIKKNITYSSLRDLSYMSNVFEGIVVEKKSNISVDSSDLDDPVKVLTDLVSNCIQTIGSIQSRLPLSGLIPREDFSQFVDVLIKCSVLPLDTIDEYEANIDSFVSDVNGLSIEGLVRDSVSEYITNLSDQDSSSIFNELISRPIIREDSARNSCPWQVKETFLYLLELLFQNDSENIGTSIAMQDVLNDFYKFILDDSGHPLVIARVFLLLPRFFEKFESNLSVPVVGTKSFVDMIDYGSTIIRNPDLNLIKISILISITYYNNLISLDSTLAEDSERRRVQLAIFELVYSLVEDSEEDSLSALLEALTVGISISESSSSQVFINGTENIIDMLFKISFKDVSNVQLNTDASECLSSLLENIRLDDYLKICEKSLPFLFKIIDESIVSARDKDSDFYAPELELSLELLSIIIEKSPEMADRSIPEKDQINFPEEVFLYTFPIIKNLILSSTDDQILRLGGQVFNNLLFKSSKILLNYTDPKTNESGIQILLQITEKFLSSELSDSAALNCGLIIISIFDKFQDYLDQNFLTNILNATIKRLIIAKEILTIENLILVFCKLILSTKDNCSDFITYLGTNFQELDSKTNTVKSGLELILPIWLSSYEVTRGYEKIIQNTLALGKVFIYGTSSISQIYVNGDIIPYQGDLIITRSMAKNMPDRYTQIPVPLKILKLFTGELNFQCQQPDADDYLPAEKEHGNDDDDDDGWEDMEDVGVPNFDKLKSYVNEDESDNEEIEGQNNDDGLKNILIQFFKECTQKNLGDFQKYYELLDDEEKKIILQNVVF